MDPETKQIMREQLELLKKINRHFLYERTWSIIKNIVVIGLIIFSVLQLQPYLDTLLGSFSQIQKTIQNPNGLDLQKLLK